MKAWILICVTLLSTLNALGQTTAADYNEIGDEYWDKKNYPDAYIHYSKAIELAPNNPTYYNNRALVQKYLGQQLEAIKDFDKAIELAPNNPTYYNNRAFAKRRQGMQAEAITDFDKAIELDPDNPDYYSNRGHTKIQFGMYPEAITDFNKAIELDPDNSNYSNVRKSTIKKLQEQREQERTITENIMLYWLRPNRDKANYQTYTDDELMIEIKALGSNNLSKSDFKVYVNNRLIPPSRSDEISLIGTTFSATIRLEEGKNEIQVRVGNHRSKTLTAYYSDNKPNLHMLAIAPSFADNFNSSTLKYTDEDAQDMAAIFQQQKGKGIYQNTKITPIIGNQATANNIEKAVERLKMQYQHNEIKDRDVVLIFMSSHGFMSNNQYYIKGDDYDPYSPTSTSVASTYVMENLSAIKCKKIFIVDACYSGGVDDGNAKDDIETQAIHSTIEALTNAQTGIVTFTSSNQAQKSYEHDIWQNGAFTYAFTQGLNGKADYNNDRKITLNEINRYLKAQVPSLVKTKFNELQSPQMYIKGLDGDLPIFVY